MARSKKESQPEQKESVKKAKPEMPSFYSDGEIQMPSVMLKDEVSFLKIWRGNLKNTDINAAWKRAEKWLEKYN